MQDNYLIFNGFARSPCDTKSQSWCQNVSGYNQEPRPDLEGCYVGDVDANSNFWLRLKNNSGAWDRHVVWGPSKDAKDPKRNSPNTLLDQDHNSPAVNMVVTKQDGQDCDKFEMVLGARSDLAQDEIWKTQSGDKRTYTPSASAKVCRGYGTPTPDVSQKADVSLKRYSCAKKFTESELSHFTKDDSDVNVNGSDSAHHANSLWHGQSKDGNRFFSVTFTANEGEPKYGKCKWQDGTWDEQKKGERDDADQAVVKASQARQDAFKQVVQRVKAVASAIPDEKGSEFIYKNKNLKLKFLL